jgi:hypothetical protein
MQPALRKSKVLRLLLALVLVQVSSFASSGGAEDVSSYSSPPNPPPTSSSTLSYTILNVEDSVDSSASAWKQLLEDMQPIIGKRLQDDKRVVLGFLQKGCSEPTPTCDTVSIYKDKDSYGVIRYKVHVHCKMKFESGFADIDAVNRDDVMEMIAEFIGAHDDKHVYRAEKQNQ